MIQTGATRNEAAHPEDEVAEKQQVLDAFGAAFDSHGGPKDGVFAAEFLRRARGGENRRITGSSSTEIPGSAPGRRQHPTPPPPSSVEWAQGMAGRNYIQSNNKNLFE